MPRSQVGFPTKRRLWLSSTPIATRGQNIDDYDDNPAIDDLLQAMERDDIDDPSDITTAWWNDWKKSLADAISHTTLT